MAKPIPAPKPFKVDETLAKLDSLVLRASVKRGIPFLGHASVRAKSRRGNIGGRAVRNG